MKNLRDQTGGVLSGAARCAIAAFAVLFILASGAGRATAAPVRLFRLTDISGFAELGFLTSLEDRDRVTSPDSNFNRVEFSQLLNLSAKAYIYHPSFLTFQGGFQIELIEDVINTNNNRVLPGGDFRFNFLQNHRESLSVFGRILATESAPLFADVYQVLSQLYGVTFFERRGWLPFRLTYQHRSQATDRTGGFDDSSNEIIFNGDYELGESSRGSVDYHLALQDLGGDDVRRQDLSMNNTSFFGDEGEKRLFTNLFFNEQINRRGPGTDKRYTVNGATILDWRHADNLSTEYRLSGRWSDLRTQSVTTLNPSFAITHDLFESLTSRVEIFGRLRDGTTGSRNQFGGMISQTYTKRLGHWGRLALRASPRVTMTYDRPKGDTALAIDESHRMTVAPDPLPRLLHPDVIESTIVVKNVKCPSERCEEGEDYEVNSVGGVFVELSLPAVERFLVEGDLVLVSYTYELGGDSDIRNVVVDVEANLSIFERLGLFGRYEINNQKLLAGDERNFRFNDYNRAVVGLELTGSWFSARAGFEDYDATFAPFRGYLGKFSVFNDSRASWRARLNAGYVYRDHRDTGETVGRLAISGIVRKRVFRRGQLELEGRYRRERWSGSSANDVDTLFLDAGFSWWYGRVEVKLEAGMAQVLREAEDKRVYRVDLRARRSF